MSYLKHPAHADPLVDLWAHVRFDNGAGNDGGNTDEDPDTFSAGFTDTFGADVAASLAPMSTQMAISSVAPGIAGLAIGFMSQARAAAEAAGISTADPTTNDMEGGSTNEIYNDILSTYQFGDETDLVLADDRTKKIDNPENYANRRLLADLFEYSVNAANGASELGEFNSGWSGTDKGVAQFLQDQFGDVASGIDDNDWNWYQPNNVWKFLSKQLGDETYSPYAIVDRDFGTFRGLNMALDEKYADEFFGEFGNGEFGEFAEANGYTDEVNAFVDEWFGNNDDLNKALTTEFGYEGRFDGQGSFWNWVDESGIDRAEVNNFIDRYNGTGDYADPFSGSTSGTSTGSTSGSGSGGGGYGGAGGMTETDALAMMFGEFATSLTDAMAGMQTDFSSMFADLPDYTTGPEIYRGSSKDEAERAGVNQLRIALDDDLLRRTRANNGGRLSFTGLQF